MGKKLLIAIVAVLCIVALVATIVLVGGSGNNSIENSQPTTPDSDGYVSRAAWITMLGECFTLNTYNQSTPYYSDVPSDHDAFAYIQSCYEWEILRIQNAFNPNEAATRAFVAETALLAALLDSDASYGKMSISDLFQQAVQLDIVEPGNAEDKMTALECSNVIESIKKYYLGLTVSDYANITLNDGISDFSSAEGIIESNGVVTMPNTLARGISEGSIFIIPGYPYGTAKKATSVKTVGGQTIIETVTPEIEEVFAELDFGYTGSPSFDDIIPLQEGVSVSPLSDVVPTESSSAGAHVVNLSSAIPLAAGSKDDPISFGVKVNITKGSLTPNIGFTDYFSIKAEQEYNKFFGKEISENAGELLKRTHTVLKYDKNGNLIIDKTEEWKSGYEITGELKVKDLYVESTCDSDGVGGLESFNCELHFEVESSLSFKGYLEGSVPIYRADIPGPYGVGVTVIFSLYVDINGEIAVSANVEHVTNVQYQDGKFKTVQDTDYETEITVGADISSGVKGEAILTVLGIELVDVSAKAGAGLDVETTGHQSGNASMICIDGECYFPTVSIEIGGNTKTLAHKLGIRAKLNLVDNKNALTKSASRTLWHYEITAEGLNNVKSCTWDTYSANVNNGNATSTEPPVTEPPVTEPPVTEPPVTEPPVTESPTPNYSILNGKWVLYAGGTDNGNGFVTDQHMFTIELMEDGSAIISSAIVYSEYYSYYQGTWSATTKSTNCFEIGFDVRGGNITMGQEAPQYNRSMTIEATVENNTMRVKKLSGDDIDGVYSETYTKNADIEPPKTTKTVYLTTSIITSDKTIQYRYNDKGCLTEAIKRYAGSGEEQIYTVASYSDYGLPTRFYTDFGSFDYTYDNNCNLIEREYGEFYLIRDTYMYDADGFRISATHLQGGLDGTLTTVENYTKNEFGYIATAEKAGTTASYSYVYDTSGRPAVVNVTTVTLAENSTDANASKVAIYKYFYDNAGNVVKIETTDETGTWDTVYTYQAIELPVESKLDKMDLSMYLI